MSGARILIVEDDESLAQMLVEVFGKEGHAVRAVHDGAQAIEAMLKTAVIIESGSTDHVALGSTRIMSTCMVLGEAAGAAALLSLHEEVAPRDLDANVLRAQLRSQGAIVDDDAIG
mgnify:CR=1 FL=1